MKIELSNDKILVLYDFLNRIGEDKKIFEDLAEQQVLWSIQAQLDKELVAPFRLDYPELIEKARENVRKNY